MLVPKEVIRPGTFWYKDEATGAPRKLVVTPELTKHWHDQGNAMIGAGLTVPVPMEHDFDAHPMTPADKLKSNAGWVKSYEMRGDRLFSVIDVQDAEVAKKLPGTIRWTSPWINSFTDGNGKAWNNVISHLALTTRPRIVDQQPFESVAAALSVETVSGLVATGNKGYCLTNATRLRQDGQPEYPIAFSLVSNGVSLSVQHKGKGPGGGQFTSSGENTSKVRPEYAHEHEKVAKHTSQPIGTKGQKKNGWRQFLQSLEKKIDHLILKITGGVPDNLKEHYEGKSLETAKHGIKMALDNIPNDDDIAFAFPPTKDKKAAPSGKLPTDDASEEEFEGEEEVGEGASEEVPDDGDESNDDNIDLEPFNDPAGDVSMTELLCDLLGALGVVCEHSDDESQFKRNLYNAAMTEIHRHVGESKAKEQGMDPKNRTNPPGQPPNNKPPGQPGQNPIIQQEQQPMYMSLEEIKKLDEPLRSVAMSMHQATVKANAKASESEKLLNSLRDKELKEAATIRAKRAALISRFMPGAKGDIDAMLSQPSMALSMGDGGSIIDPMHQTLAVLEKGLANLPRLLTTETSALSVQAQPTDADTLSEARIDELADMQAARMGCPPVKKAS